MSDSPPLQHGDVVIHPRRPEWGRGVVKQASQITYRGAPAQRVAVQFANKGRVVINTAVAPLVPSDQGRRPPETKSPAESDPATPSPTEAPTAMQNRSNPTASPDAGWLNALERSGRQGPATLAELPEAMTDPFLSNARRLEVTLESYRFNDSPRGLIEWAMGQTGLDDPLSHYTRHELEDAFARFARNRDQHLQALARSLKQQGETKLLNDAVRTTNHRPARNALQKAMR